MSSKTNDTKVEMVAKENDDTAVQTRDEHIKMVGEFIEAQGISLEDLKAFQATRSEVTEEPALRPTDLQGVTTETMSNEKLTAELVSLQARFKNLLLELFEHEKF